ncbi:MAG: hypothetical protein M3P30_10315 [Chloroflexota bacterium]|nr:hypothetical protein [Chloroflexota bacterium]
MDLGEIPTMSEGDTFIFRSVEFPQANDLRKVFSVTQLASVQDTATADEIAAYLDMVPREGAYYGSAACSLRLLQKYESAAGTNYRLTEMGRHWFEAESWLKPKLMISRTMDSPHVKYVAHRLGHQLPLAIPIGGALLDQAAVARALIELVALNASTQARRASTIVAWMRTLN